MNSIIENLGTKKFIIICVVALLFVAAIISTVIIVKKSNTAKLAASAKTGNSASASELLSTSKASAATTDISSTAATEQTATSTSSKSTTKKATTTSKATTTTPAAAPAPTTAEPTPAPKGQDLLSEYHGWDIDGRIIDSSIFSGKKLTMINLWATYCGYCINEMPDLAKIHKDYASKGFQVVGVLCDSNEVTEAKTIISQTGANYLHIRYDFDIQEAAKLTNGGSSISGIPYTFFVDSTGHQVGDGYSGYRSESSWKSIINELLKNV